MDLWFRERVLFYPCVPRTHGPHPQGMAAAKEDDRGYLKDSENRTHRACLNSDGLRPERALNWREKKKTSE